MNYDIPEKPLWLTPIGGLPEANEQRRWIVIHPQAETCSLRVIDLDTIDDQAESQEKWSVPYSAVWQVIKLLKLEPRKYWVIALDMRYILHQAEMLNALADGTIEIPYPQKAGSKLKRAGKMTYTDNTLEIDLVVGRHELKFLDWRNFGVEAGHVMCAATQHQTLAHWQLLLDYMAACRSVGITVERTTAAQLGWAHYRRHHMPAILSTDLDVESRQLERAAYFGGRNEAYQIGAIPGITYSLDVRSCYAEICKTTKLPVACKEVYAAGCSAERLTEDPNLLWIAKVVIATTEPAYPVRYAGETIYPTGEYVTTLCDPKIRHALTHGRLLKILSARSYYADYAFASFADWYQRRKAEMTSSHLANFVTALKCSFNATLGYSARQKYACLPWANHLPHQWFLGTTRSPEDNQTLVRAQILDGIGEWVKIGGEPRTAMPALHATITSACRIKMWELMQCAGPENVHYLDTDGLLCNMEAINRLTLEGHLVPNVAGKLDYRLKKGRCVINGTKSYKLGRQVICAGLASTHHKLWEPKPGQATKTGILQANGQVTPFLMRCDDQGGESQQYRNEIC